MNRFNITAFQAERTRKIVRRHLEFTERLIARMNALDFERDDELFKAAVGTVRPLIDLHEVLLKLARRKDRR